MSKDENDLIHIKNIIKGDRLSEKYIYNKYYEIINNYLIFKYPYNTYLDDDASEIMIKIFENIGDFNMEKSKFHTWVLNISKNYMIDKSRTQKKGFYQNIGHNDESIMFSSYSSSYTMPDTLLESKDTMNILSTSIKPNDYSMLCMKYLDGFNYNEIGMEFNTSSVTVSNRINYVKTKIKNGKGNSSLTIK